MAGGGLHSHVRLGGSAVAEEQANGSGPPPPASGVVTRGEVTDELERALLRLERANEALQRENARLARAAGGQSGSAAAVRLTRAERRWSEQAEAAERHWRERAEAAERHWSERAQAAELEVERLVRLLATPRHRAVERARERLMRSGSLYTSVRRIWAWVVKILRLQQ
jgi:hypothetical protein